MKCYCPTLHNHWYLDDSKYFIPSPPPLKNLLNWTFCSNKCSHCTQWITMPTNDVIMNVRFYFKFFLAHKTFQRFLVTLNDQPVSVVIIMNFLNFSTSFKPLHGFVSNFVWKFLGCTPTKFLVVTFNNLYLVCKQGT